MITIIFAMFFVLSGFQPDIDYTPKSLFKEIEKLWEIEYPHLEEVHIPDSIIGEMEENGKFFKVSTLQGSPSDLYVYIGRVSSCRAGGCSINPEPGWDGSSEYFDYFFLIDSIPSINLVKVYNYQATHGYEISARGWLKQFIGYSGHTHLQVGKNIDAISGATISVHSITRDIEKKMNIFKAMM